MADMGCTSRLSLDNNFTIGSSRADDNLRMLCLDWYRASGSSRGDGTSTNSMSLDSDCSVTCGGAEDHRWRGSASDEASTE